MRQLCLSAADSTPERWAVPVSCKCGVTGLIMLELAVAEPETKAFAKDREAAASRREQHLALMSAFASSTDTLAAAKNLVHEVGLAEIRQQWAATHQ